MATWVSQRQCARELGISPAYVQKLIKQGRLRRNSKKQVELEAAREIVSGTGVHSGVHQASQPDENGEYQDKDQLERGRRLKADQEEINIAERLGDLVKAEEVEKTWADLLTRFKAKMQALPTKAALVLATMDDPREIENHLKTLCREALEELSGDR